MQLSFEVSPDQAEATIDVINKHDERQRIVDNITFFVPHIQGKPYAEVLQHCNSLQQAGLKVCAHLAVRNILAQEQPQQLLQQLQGIDQLLLLGGDANKPHHFSSVMEFLHTTPINNLPTQNIAFACFASEHPHANKQQQWRHLVDKINWVEQHQLNTRLYTQIEYDPEIIIQLKQTLLQKDINTPLCAGFVAPCKMDKLIRISSAVGVGNALKFVKKNNVFKLLGRYDSQSFIQPISNSVDGLHCYSFGNAAGGLQQLLQHNHS